MLVPNRNYSSPEYRYGFNGKEKDDEVKGSGNSLNYKFRMHDPRVGRFFAVDPLSPRYPWYTPYSFSGNKVIAYVELEGLEEEPAYLKYTSHYGKSTYYIVRAIDFKNRNPLLTAPDYYLNYGNKYIKIFNNDVYFAMLSIGNRKGIDFLKNATINLQKAIEDKLLLDPEIEKNNEKFTDFAFDSHVKAYVDAGFLEIGVVGQALVSLAVEPKDLFDEKGIRQAETMLVEMKKFHLKNPDAAAKMAVDVFMNYKTLVQLATKYYIDNKDYFIENKIEFEDLLDRLTYAYGEEEIKTKNTENTNDKN